MATVPRRTLAAVASIAALVLISIPLAAPGAALVPGAEGDAPGWLLGIFGDGLGLSAGVYLGLLYAAVLAWVAVVALAGRIHRRAVGAAIAALVVLFTLAPPLLSLDLFSYISYARLGVENGLNPYEYPPSAIPGDEAAMRVMAFRDAVSVYGPLFTLVSYPLGALGVPAALWSLKVLAGLSVAAMAALTARMATARGVEPRAAAAFVALNPLVLVHVVGGGHNDGLMAALAVGAVALIASERQLAGGASAISAIAVKSAAAVVVPFAVVGSTGRGRVRLLAALAAAALVVAAVALAFFGPSALEALSVAGNNQSTVSRWSVPGALSRAFGLDIGLLRGVMGVAYALAVLALLRWVASGADWVRAAGWATLGLLVATAYITPWYLVWLLPLAAISRDRALIAATAAFTAFQTINAIPV